jgi:hypothetical protein
VRNYVQLFIVTYHFPPPNQDSFQAVFTQTAAAADEQAAELAAAGFIIAGAGPIYIELNREFIFRLVTSASGWFLWETWGPGSPFYPSESTFIRLESTRKTFSHGH